MPAPQVLSLVSTGVLLAALSSGAALAQNFPNLPISPQQRATAQQVAQAGVPLSELAPNAPDSHTVKRGDTLWGISGLFLRSPWRWPELWGMNLQAIRNPHLIYPGQRLVLDTSSGRAVLRVADGELPTVKVTPRTRYESLGNNAIPTLDPRLIEPFLTEGMIVDNATFQRAPRLVATPENRVLLSRGDRAYARGQYSDGGSGEALVTDGGKPREYRVFRSATPLRDPGTNEILGYEAQFVGRAVLVRSESRVETPGKDGKSTTEVVPATVDITLSKEEMRVGDRLVAEPPPTFPTYVPSAPSQPMSGQIVSVYGNAVTYASQNQVVALNRGTRDGLAEGHVLAIMTNSARAQDRTDTARPAMRLPGERNGLMMVFRTFDRVSYALVIEIADGVKVGDRFMNP